MHQRHYATIESVHSPERTTYAYAILPGADPAATQAAADDPPAEVLENDSRVQAVRAGRILAANFWQAATIRNVTMEQPASLIRETGGRQNRISISDPTHAQDQLAFTINGNPHLQVGGAEEVDVTEVRGGVRVTVATRGRRGRPVEFTLTG